MKTAVILCAGYARRMKASGVYIPKPLLKVAGRRVLERTILLLEEKGIENFLTVVNPENREPIRSLLDSLGIKYKLIVNETPDRENGYSLYLACKYLEDSEFVLTMGDHIYSYDFVDKAIKGKGLIVDRLALYTDKREATKVLCVKGEVKDIGKGISKFSGYDTGFFVLGEEFVEVVYGLKKERERFTLSEIVKEARLECTEVSGEFWTDIDTPEDVKKAKAELVRESVKKREDGVVSRALNRKLSTWVSERLIDTISPNQATWLVFLIGVLSSVITLFSPPLGGMLLQLSSMLDGVDGEIARASLRVTKFGGWLDSLLDRCVDFLFLSALALYLKPSQELLPWVFGAMFGSLMVSYSTERFKASYCEDPYVYIRPLKYLPAKRDERILIVMMMCLLGWIETLFVLLALLTNARVLATVFLVYKKKGNT